MNREKVIIVLKAVRNVLIALFSFGWVIPLSSGIYGIFFCFSFLFEAIRTEADGELQNEMAVAIASGSGLINFGMLWLAIVIGFWALVAANKLWPIRKIPKPDQNDN
ncbi:MAG: hypothetical protein ACYS18_10990 [Planctomycetota bacterium]|jgi:hypothetical protein